MSQKEVLELIKNFISEFKYQKLEMERNKNNKF